MIRAGVFIGVDKTGNLQKLNDAASGARRMYNWALSQGMPEGSHAKLITDEGGQEVSSDQICNAIEEIINGAGVDQLIIYFAGHGVNINRGEQWLLTRAPERTSAAINVSGSVELARYCGIQHVVIISDACRVAPEGIQAQNVHGVDMFPNTGSGDRAKPVDQFFACLLGRTAAELPDPMVAADNYTALYTSALLEALKGMRSEVLDSVQSPDSNVGNWRYVKSRKLQSFLEIEVPRRVKKLKLVNKVNQNPDAIITSDPDKNWVSRLEWTQELRSAGGGPSDKAPAGSGPSDIMEIGGPIKITYGSGKRSDLILKPHNLSNFTQYLVNASLEGNIPSLSFPVEQAKLIRVAGAKGLAQTVQYLGTPFGPDHYESQCGIKVRGGRIIDFFALGVKAELLGDAGNLLRIQMREGEAASILLRFSAHIGTVIPVIGGFITAISFENGELIDIAYEPSANSRRWSEYQHRAADIRELRAIAASSSQHSRFRLDQADPIKVARKMQLEKGFDPTLSIYAAYAYHDLQDIDRIREMAEYQRIDLGITLFDLALLSRSLIGKKILPDDRIVPFIPMLSQGWALLQAHQIKLHPKLSGIESTMRDSLWSLFDDAGLEKLRQAMETNEVL